MQGIYNYLIIDNVTKRVSQVDLLLKISINVYICFLHILSYVGMRLRILKTQSKLAKWQLAVPQWSRL